jgi:hypothetical protein
MRVLRSSTAAKSGAPRVKLVRAYATTSASVAVSGVSKVYCTTSKVSAVTGGSSRVRTLSQLGVRSGAYAGTGSIVTLLSAQISSVLCGSSTMNQLLVLPKKSARSKRLTGSGSSVTSTVSACWRCVSRGTRCATRREYATSDW